MCSTTHTSQSSHTHSGDDAIPRLPILGFPPLAVGNKREQTQEMDSYIQKEKQYTKRYKINTKNTEYTKLENKNAKQKTDIKRILENVSRLITRENQMKTLEVR